MFSRCRSPLNRLALSVRSSARQTISLQGRPTILSSSASATSSTVSFSSTAHPVAPGASSSTPPLPKRNTLWRSTAFLRPPLALTQPVPLSASAFSSGNGRAPALQIQVRYLADCPELIPAVAQALWEEWGDNFAQFDQMRDVAAVEKWVREECCETMQLGCTVIGVHEGAFVGCAMLCPEDTPSTHPYFGTVPWACYNFVSPAYRGRGLSRVVWGALIDLSRQWGYSHCWAVAQGTLVDMYTPMGFRVIETDVDFWGEPATVLRLDFPPPALTPQALLPPNSSSSVVPPADK